MKVTMQKGSDRVVAGVESVAWVDGKYTPLANASIAMTDRGFVRSDATYDVAHVWKGRFFRLDDHIDRFYASMSALRMELPQTRDEIRNILHECVRQSGLQDAYVQMTCTRGVPPQGSRDPRQCQNRFSAFAQPFVWLANEDQRRAGLHLIVSQTERIPPEALDPRIKNFHWHDLTKGIFEAFDKGAQIAVHPDRHGYLTEGAGFNLFVVRDGALATPSKGVFEGLTRRTVLELADDFGITAKASDLIPMDLQQADEIFITSTAGGIMPVTRCENRAVRSGKIGPITQQLHDAYWALHDQNQYMETVNGLS